MLQQKEVLKSRIRKEIKEQLNKQSKAQRLRKSLSIQQKLFKLTEFKRASCIMFYISRDEEVQTRLMISAAQKLGKKIVIPMVLGSKMAVSLVEDPERELTLGPYGIRQPKKQYIRKISPDKIELVVVPGLAFDKQGKRLGRGRGYYDKFLADLPEDTARLGLAFDFQVLNSLPVLSHDISMTKVISA